MLKVPCSWRPAAGSSQAEHDLHDLAALSASMMSSLRSCSNHALLQLLRPFLGARMEAVIKVR